MKNVENSNGIDIYFEAIDEDISIDEALSFELTGIDHSETIKDVKNGNLEYFCAKVVGAKNGIHLAEQFLGCCVYESEEDFLKSETFIDLKNSVVEQSSTNIKKLCA